MSKTVKNSILLILLLFLILSCSKPIHRSIICNEWVVINQEPSVVIGEGVAPDTFLYCSIKNFLGDKQNIRNLTLQIKENDNTINFELKPFDANKKDTWGISNINDWYRFKKLLEKSHGEFLYSTLKIDYYDSLKKYAFHGKFYSIPYKIPIPNKWGDLRIKEIIPDASDEGILLGQLRALISKEIEVWNEVDEKYIKLYKLTGIDYILADEGVIYFKIGSFQNTIDNNKNDLALSEIIRSIYRNIGNSQVIHLKNVAFILRGTASKEAYQDGPFEKANFKNEPCYNIIGNQLINNPLTKIGLDYKNDDLPGMRACQAAQFINNHFRGQINDIDSRVFPLYYKPEGTGPENRRLDIYFLVNEMESK